MLSPSDFNNAVPQFTNGDYASNPINPQYIAEPDAVDYNRGAEPLQTLPAQWWNWFLNRFTNRFNKVNIYVKNIFNELTQLLSLVSETPSGTESTPTVGQMKDMFETKYPDYLKTTPALSNTYVPQTTRVNGHELCENITITCVACASCNGSGTAFGTAATKNTGTAAGCIPIVGTALGTTNGQFIATDASGCLKPSGYTASCFRSSSWTPSCVSCAGYAKSSGSATTATGLLYSGTGDSVVSAYQSCYTYCGSPEGWASYLIFNHGDGSKYFHQMIRMPFENVPQYQRMVYGQLQGWHRFITDENIGSQSVCRATSAGYASCAGVANARYCSAAVYVCFKCMDHIPGGNCIYDIYVSSRTGTNVLVAEPPLSIGRCCSNLLFGKIFYSNYTQCIGCAVGQGLSSYCLGGVLLG